MNPESRNRLLAPAAIALCFVLLAASTGTMMYVDAHARIHHHHPSRHIVHVPPSGHFNVPTQGAYLFSAFFEDALDDALEMLTIHIDNCLEPALERLDALAAQKELMSVEEKVLDVEWVDQLPALPTGCEITAATAALNYYGYDISNVELDGYLEQGWDNPDPDECFQGYCSGDGWFVNPPPVVEALNACIAVHGGTQTALDITGTAPEALYDYLRKGTPVIVWVTTYLQEREIADVWYVDGKEVTASQQDHCMTLIGFTAQEVCLLDPFSGAEWYAKEAFEASYAVRGQRAVIITEQ